MTFTANGIIRSCLAPRKPRCNIYYFTGSNLIIIGYLRKRHASRIFMTNSFDDDTKHNLLMPLKTKSAIFRCLRLVLYILFFSKVGPLFSEETKNEKSIHFQSKFYNLIEKELDEKRRFFITIMNNTDAPFTKFRIFTSCGCIKMSSDNLPTPLLPGINRIEFKVDPLPFNNEPVNQTLKIVSTDGVLLDEIEIRILKNITYGIDPKIKDSYAYFGRFESILKASTRKIDIPYRQAVQDKMDIHDLQLRYDNTKLSVVMYYKSKNNNEEHSWTLNITPTINWKIGENIIPLSGWIDDPTKKGDGDLNKFNIKITGDLVGSPSITSIPWTNDFDLKVPEDNISFLCTKKGTKIDYVIEKQDEKETFHLTRPHDDESLFLFLKKPEGAFITLIREMREFPFNTELISDPETQNHVLFSATRRANKIRIIRATSDGDDAFVDEFSIKTKKNPKTLSVIVVQGSDKYQLEYIFYLNRFQLMNAYSMPRG